MGETAVWTDPRLFSMLIFDPEAPPAPNVASYARPEALEGRADRLAKAVDELLDLALQMGGGIEYCHGIGVKLDRWMDREWDGGLSLARRLKHAVDPGATLNPGKLGL